jgi:hypothetical protein
MGFALNGLIVIVGTCLLFSVKVNLFSVPGQTAGLRLDDALLAGIGLLLSAVFLVSGRVVFRPLEVKAALVLFVFVISNFFNAFLFSRSNLLYSARFAEYFLFFYIGYYFARSHSLKRVTKWLLGANATVMVLQLLGLVGGYASEEYIAAGNFERVVGLTGGPWEVGTIINFSLAILLTRSRGRSFAVRNLILFLLTFALVLLTGARMGVVAHICIYAVFLIHRAQRPIRVVAAAGGFSVLFVLSIFSIPNPVQARSVNLFSSDNMKAFGDAYRHVTPSREVSAIPWNDGRSTAPDEEGSMDASWAIRLVKWTYMLKLWVMTPFAWLIGLGPGVSGPALDGAWLRLLVETGIVGVLTFANFLLSIARLNEVAEGLVIALVINMLMTDTHIAYKAMSFFSLRPDVVIEQEPPRRFFPQRLRRGRLFCESANCDQRLSG